MRIRLDLMVALAGLALGSAASTSPALAQPQRPPSSQALNTGPGCEGSSRAQAATGPAPAARDGTAPGSAGSTGWSGGTGGSQIGTNTAGALPSSPTWQPPTARGLDPISAPVRPAPVC